MNARTLGTHRNRIRRTAVAWLDIQPDAPRQTWLISYDGEEIDTISAATGCAESLREEGYTVELTAPTAEQRLAAIVELCQRFDAVSADADALRVTILAIALAS